MSYKKLICIFLGTCLLLSGCGRSDTAKDTLYQETSNQETVSSDTASEKTSVTGNLPQIDMTRWQYNEETDAYWQVGVSYCETPADASYETLGIYVPGAYFDGTDNGDGTYTCTINQTAEISGYTALTAPMVIPVETPGYSAMAAPTGYVNSTSAYTDAGFVYIYAGCRGRDAGAPAGVTDLKAAIRYIRYNEDILPGDTDRIFSFGMSGGGAQSAILGASGDSSLYTPYLEEIGAVSGVSDAVAGSMCWCPITNLDTADAAYEWNMGVTRTDLTDEMQQISYGLAEAYAGYINSLGLTDANGTVLTLEASDEGIYQAGSYYEYIKQTIEISLNNFLEDTTFPYSASSSGGMAGGFGGRRDMTGDFTEDMAGDFAEDMAGDFAEDMTGGFAEDMAGGFHGKDGGDGNKPDLRGEIADGNFDLGNIPDAGKTGAENEYYNMDGIDRNDTASGLSLSGTYETAQDYIDALNADKEWVIYDSTTNTAEITGVADFVTALKTASKSLGAFDQLDCGQGENTLFGYGDGQGAHFDFIMAEVLEGTDYSADYEADLSRTDELGNSVEYRLNMYTPLYYISDYYDGYQTANVAQYWRIRTGINQSDTALSTEVNLALALESYGADVDFATVWGMGHVQAERTGDSASNFIEWVNSCLE